MIDFIRADHINICVPPERLEEAKEFYRNIIGLPLDTRPDHLFSSKGYWFKAGDISLHISIEPFIGRTVRHTAFQVSDIAEARAVIEQYNLEIIEEPCIPDRSRFAFIDPFGNRMELLQIIDK